MAKIVQVWEVAAAAETKVEALFDGVLEVLHAQNQRLAQLLDEIKLAQPKASGNVCLELYPCGSSVCRGCPHARWVQYRWVPGRAGGPDILKSINLSAAKKDPILALKRKSESYGKTSVLIREAKTILIERSKLIASLRTMEYAAKLN